MHAMINLDDFLDDDNCCPLCMEEMDATDLSFRPCECGYQICIWCWNQINERFDGRCPNCRREYDTSNVHFENLDQDTLAKETSRLSKKKSKSAKPTSGTSTSGSTAVAASSAGSAGTAAGGLLSAAAVIQPGSAAARNKDLANVRVIQRNLVYVVGLPPSIAREDILKSHQYFGQYGRALKVVINKPHGQHTARNSFSAYVTFLDAESARLAIECVDGISVEDRLLKASFGTTKYCSYFLRGINCSNPDCMYLHEYGEEIDTFTKEDMILRKTAFQSSIHPQAYPDNHLWAALGFPPPPSGRAPPPQKSEPRREEDAATVLPSTAPAALGQQQPPPPPQQQQQQQQQQHQDWPSMSASALPVTASWASKTGGSNASPAVQSPSLSSTGWPGMGATAGIGAIGPSAPGTGTTMQSTGMQAHPQETGPVHKMPALPLMFFHVVMPTPKMASTWARGCSGGWDVFPLAGAGAELFGKQLSEILPEVL